MDLESIRIERGGENSTLSFVFFAPLPAWASVGGEVDLDVDGDLSTGCTDPLRKGTDSLLELVPYPRLEAKLYRWGDGGFRYEGHLKVLRSGRALIVQIPSKVISRKLRFKGFSFTTLRDGIKGNYLLRPGGVLVINDGRDKQLPGWADLRELRVSFREREITVAASFYSLPPIPVALPPTLGETGEGWGFFNVFDLLYLDSDGDGREDYALQLEHRAVRLRGGPLNWSLNLVIFKRRGDGWVEKGRYVLRDLSPYRRAYLSWLMGGLSVFNLRVSISLSKFGLSILRSARLVMKGDVVSAIADYFPPGFSSYVSFKKIESDPPHLAHSTFTSFTM